MWLLPDLAFGLEDYAAYLGIADCQIFGIKRDTDPIRGCRTYWNQVDRTQLGHALAKAIELYEEELKYPLVKKFIETEVHDYRCPLRLNWGYLREVGIRATTSLAADKAVPAGDPVIITHAVTFTDPCELIVYYPISSYPGQTYTIKPSSVTISLGMATITIPRCRLLKPEYFLDYAADADRPDYSDATIWLDEVDLGRVYTDTSQGAYLSFIRPCSCLCGGCAFGCTCGCDCSPGTPCGVAQQTACGRPDDRRIGTVRVEPAAYSAGAWTATSLLYNRIPDKVTVSYTAGWFAGTPDACSELQWRDQRALLALAHVNLPTALCLCDIHRKFYDNDNLNLPRDIMLNIPWGFTRGAYEAWKIVQGRKIGAGGLLGWS